MTGLSLVVVVKLAICFVAMVGAGALFVEFRIRKPSWVGQRGMAKYYRLKRDRRDRDD